MVRKSTYFFCKRLGAGVCSPFNPTIFFKKWNNDGSALILVLGQVEMVGFCEHAQRVLNGGAEWRVLGSHDGKWRQEKKGIWREVFGGKV